jgi:hypothetical protein
MRKFIIILTLIPLLSCNSEYNHYYYGKENFRAFLCSWDHFIVVKDLGDSLQIWHLDDECNAGYWSTDDTIIQKLSGDYGKVAITSIEDNKINLKYDRGHEIVEFELSRQTKTGRSYRVINIVQMLEIDEEMEQFIQSNSTNAEKSTLYLTENYIADDKVEIMNPNEFYKYYRNKKKAKADEVINELKKE